MNPDRIAAMTPLIRDVQAGPEGLCATFETVGSPRRWVQFGYGVINAEYAGDQAPDFDLPGLGGPQIESWEARKFVTVKPVDTDPAAIARWIDAWLGAALGVAPDAPLKRTLEQL